MTQELCFLTAVEASRLFLEKSLSPVELMAAVIHRSEEQEPLINAFSHRYFDQAMEQARASERRYMRGQPMGVLDGMKPEKFRREPTPLKQRASVTGFHKGSGI